MTRVAGADTWSQFDAFAPHYDTFTSGSDYERRTECVLAHARAHGLAGRLADGYRADDDEEDDAV